MLSQESPEHTRILESSKVLLTNSCDLEWIISIAWPSVFTGTERDLAPPLLDCYGAWKHFHKSSGRLEANLPDPQSRAYSKFHSVYITWFRHIQIISNSQERVNLQANTLLLGLNTYTELRKIVLKLLGWPKRLFGFFDNILCVNTGWGHHDCVPFFVVSFLINKKTRWETTPPSGCDFLRRYRSPSALWSGSCILLRGNFHSGAQIEISWQTGSVLTVICQSSKDCKSLFQF